MKTFSITLKNRYQVLEDEGLAAEEEGEEIERDFQVMGKAYTAERVLGRPRKRKKPWISDE